MNKQESEKIIITVEDIMKAPREMSIYPVHLYINKLAYTILFSLAALFLMFLIYKKIRRQKIRLWQIIIFVILTTSSVIVYFFRYKELRILNIIYFTLLELSR